MVFSGVNVMFWAHREEAVELYFTIRGFFRDEERFFEDWLDRLVCMGTIEQEDWERENGKFWGFPECCIEWYILLGHIPEAQTIGRAVYMDKYFGQDDYLDEYVKCPTCRTEEKINE